MENIPIYRGIFSSTKSYPISSIVESSSSATQKLYISITDVPTGSSLSNTSYWVRYNKKGLEIEDVDTEIEKYTGDLDDLQTTEKDNLVGAINELDDEQSALSETVSDIVDGTIEIPHQVDWNQSDSTAKDYIKNKPNIPATQVQSDWNQSDNTQVDFIKNKPTIPSEYVLPIATTSSLGGIKPDGTTITVDTTTGVASAVGGGDSHTIQNEVLIIG